MGVYSLFLESLPSLRETRCMPCESKDVHRRFHSIDVWSNLALFYFQRSVVRPCGALPRNYENLFEAKLLRSVAIPLTDSAFSDRLAVSTTTPPPRYDGARGIVS